jgi:hypothetical protein
MTVSQLVQALQGMGGVNIGQKIAQGGSATLVPAWNVQGGGMFSVCGGNELISCMVTDDMLSTWLGMEGSIVDPEPTKIIGWVGPTGTGNGSPEWDRTDDCEDCKKVEWSKCEIQSCFGEICKSGGDLRVTQLGLLGCDKEPIYYIRGPMAGTRMTNDAEWQLALAAAVAKQDFERVNIIGNKTVNARQWDGLQVLINTPVIDYRNGLRCTDAEPLIVDWANAAMTDNICNILSAVIRRIRNRARFLGGVQQGDIALVMTSVMRDALIDFAGCGCGPCTGTGVGTVTINPLDSRQERARLATGGTYGMGMYEVDGIPVDIITNDWIPQTSQAPYFCSDIFVLVRSVGGLRVLYGQYQDFSRTLSGVDLSNLVFGARVTDGGRFLSYSKSHNECFNQTLLMKPRLKLSAPWLQARILDVCAPFDIPPMVPIPGDAYNPAGAVPTNPAAYPILPYSYGACT